jgi:hypothetical protein
MLEIPGGFSGVDSIILNGQTLRVALEDQVRRNDLRAR